MATEQDTISRPGLGKAVLVPGISGCGLGCLGTLLLCSAALSLGFAILPVNTAFLGGAAGFAVVLTTAIVSRARRRKPPWRLFIAETAAIAVILLAYFSWDTPRYVFQCVFGEPIPRSVRIIRAGYDEHPMDPSAWIHFTASPQDVCALVRTSQLAPAPGADPGQAGGDFRPKWWTPAELRPPAQLFSREFFHRDHTDIVSYVVGVWVDARTNEAYGYYISF